MITRFSSQFAAVCLMFLLVACGGSGGGGETPDTVAPVITLLGDNPISIAQNSSFTDPGTRVTDNVDTGLTATVTGSVDTSVIGEYTLSYNATDAAGNRATEVSRVVNVLGPQVGKFTGTTISGIQYQTATLSGTTNQMGEFDYGYNETIRFFLGGTDIGYEVPAKSEMKIRDLLPNAQIYTKFSEVRRLLALNVNNSGERKAFNEFSNILSFLYTLDDDADPSNGVNIVSGVETLFDGVEIDFGSDYSEFHKGSILRQITHQASSMELISTADIMKYGFGLDLFYATESIEHNLFVATSTSIDKNGDDVIDQETNREYDASGNMTLERTFDGNLPSENTFTMTYGSNGSLLSRSQDMGSDGNIIGVNTNEYDANNNLVLQTYSYLGGEDSISQTKTYDDLGNLLVHVQGEQTSTYTYDTNGNILTFSYVISGDFAFNELTTYAYDNMGNVLRVNIDRNSDGTDESIRHYTYDENGNVLTFLHDTSGDGSWISFSVQTYDEQGNRLTLSYDNDQDGVFEGRSTYVYNSDGFLLTESYQESEEGEPYIVFSFEYDGSNNILSWQWDAETSGDLYISYNYTYDSENNRVATENDSDGDGVMDMARVTTYNSSGNRLTVTEDRGIDGIINKTTTVVPVSANWRAVLSTFSLAL